jgi:pyruvate dehydrogenase E1 component
LSNKVKLEKKEKNKAPSPRGRAQGNGNDGNKILESLEALLEVALVQQGADRTKEFLASVSDKLRAAGVDTPRTVSTPYVNTIQPEEQPEFPGDWEMEVRIKSHIRWNAMAMVVNANRKHNGLGGHISTFASAATLYEIAFNHFFRGRTDKFT